MDQADIIKLYHEKRTALDTLCKKREKLYGDTDELLKHEWNRRDIIDATIETVFKTFDAFYDMKNLFKDIEKLGNDIEALRQTAAWRAYWHEQQAKRIEKTREYNEYTNKKRTRDEEDEKEFKEQLDKKYKIDEPICSITERFLLTESKNVITKHKT